MIEKYMEHSRQGVIVKIIKPIGSTLKVCLSNGYEYLVHRRELNPIREDSIRASLGLRRWAEVYARLDPMPGFRATGLQTREPPAKTDHAA